MNSCKIMKTSEFFTKNVNPFLLGAFFSRYVFVNDNKYIVAYSSFHKSPKITVPNLDLKEYYATYRDILNEESGDYPYWQLKKDISKDIKLPKAEIFFLLEGCVKHND